MSVLFKRGSFADLRIPPKPKVLPAPRRLPGGWETSTRVTAGAAGTALQTDRSERQCAAGRQHFFDLISPIFRLKSYLPSAPLESAALPPSGFQQLRSRDRRRIAAPMIRFSQDSSYQIVGGCWGSERISAVGFVFHQRGDRCMCAQAVLLTLVLFLCPVIATAGATEWRRYVIPGTQASVDVPVTIFSEDAGAPEGGIGRRFVTKDRRADLTVQSVPNPNNDSPATFLAKRSPPPGIQYERVTARFFAVSSIRNGRTWYNRCNRAKGYMNCVLINYPAAEERQWDAVVTRISLSLD